MKRVLAFVIAVLAMILLAPSLAAAEKRGTISGLYNQRYCEIFTVTMPEPPNFKVDVFNTVGLNGCPADAWEAIDLDRIKAETGSLGAARNGPRRWLIDKIAGGKAGAPVEMDGLPMRHVAVLTVPSLTPVPYTEMKIARITTWVFNKGRNLNFLVSPEGRKYALQAYTTTIDHSLRAKNLSQMGENAQMALPEGWNYRSIKLKKQLRLKAPGMATIMRDPLGGTYQKFSWPKNFFKPVKKPSKHRR